MPEEIGTAAQSANASGEVPLPDTEPWLVVGGVAKPPQLESFLCPQPRCGKRIYVHPVTEEQRLHDADLDAIRKEDNEG